MNMFRQTGATEQPQNSSSLSESPDKSPLSRQTYGRSQALTRESSVSLGTGVRGLISIPSSVGWTKAYHKRALTKLVTSHPHDGEKLLAQKLYQNGCSSIDMPRDDGELAAGNLLQEGSTAFSAQSRQHWATPKKQMKHKIGEDVKPMNDKIFIWDHVVGAEAKYQTVYKLRQTSEIDAQWNEMSCCLTRCGMCLMALCNMAFSPTMVDKVSAALGFNISQQGTTVDNVIWKHLLQSINICLAQVGSIHVNKGRRQLHHVVYPRKSCGNRLQEHKFKILEMKMRAFDTDDDNDDGDDGNLYNHHVAESLSKFREFLAKCLDDLGAHRQATFDAITAKRRSSLKSRKFRAKRSCISAATSGSEACEAQAMISSSSCTAPGTSPAPPRNLRPHSKAVLAYQAKAVVTRLEGTRYKIEAKMKEISLNLDLYRRDFIRELEAREQSQRDHHDALREEHQKLRRELAICRIRTARQDCRLNHKECNVRLRDIKMLRWEAEKGLRAAVQVWQDFQADHEFAVSSVTKRPKASESMLATSDIRQSIHERWSELRREQLSFQLSLRAEFNKQHAQHGDLGRTWTAAQEAHATVASCAEEYGVSLQKVKEGISKLEPRLARYRQGLQEHNLLQKTYRKIDGSLSSLRLIMASEQRFLADLWAETGPLARIVGELDELSSLLTSLEGLQGACESDSTSKSLPQRTAELRKKIMRGTKEAWRCLLHVWRPVGDAANSLKELSGRRLELNARLTMHCELAYNEHLEKHDREVGTLVHRISSAQKGEASDHVSMRSILRAQFEEHKVAPLMKTHSVLKAGVQSLEQSLVERKQDIHRSSLQLDRSRRRLCVLEQSRQGRDKYASVLAKELEEMQHSTEQSKQSIRNARLASEAVLACMKQLSMANQSNAGDHGHCDEVCMDSERNNMQQHLSHISRKLQAIRIQNQQGHGRCESQITNLAGNSLEHSLQKYSSAPRTGARKDSYLDAYSTEGTKLPLSCSQERLSKSRMCLVNTASKLRSYAEVLQQPGMRNKGRKGSSLPWLNSMLSRMTGAVAAEESALQSKEEGRLLGKIDQTDNLLDTLRAKVRRVRFLIDGGLSTVSSEVSAVPFERLDDVAYQVARLLRVPLKMERSACPPCSSPSVEESICQSPDPSSDRAQSQRRNANRNAISPGGRSGGARSGAASSSPIYHNFMSPQSESGLRLSRERRFRTATLNAMRRRQELQEEGEEDKNHDIRLALGNNAGFAQILANVICGLSDSESCSGNDQDNIEDLKGLEHQIDFGKQAMEDHELQMLASQDSQDKPANRIVSEGAFEAKYLGSPPIQWVRKAIGALIHAHGVARVFAKSRDAATAATTAAASAKPVKALKVDSTRAAKSMKTLLQSVSSSGCYPCEQPHPLRAMENTGSTTRKSQTNKRSSGGSTPKLKRAKKQSHHRNTAYGQGEAHATQDVLVDGKLILNGTPRSIRVVMQNDVNQRRTVRSRKPKPRQIAHGSLSRVCQAEHFSSCTYKRYTFSHMAPKSQASEPEQGTQLSFKLAACPLRVISAMAGLFILFKRCTAQTIGGEERAGKHQISGRLIVAKRKMQMLSAIIKTQGKGPDPADPGTLAAPALRFIETHQRLKIKRALSRATSTSNEHGTCNTLHAAQLSEEEQQLMNDDVPSHMNDPPLYLDGSSHTPVEGSPPSIKKGPSETSNPKAQKNGSLLGAQPKIHRRRFDNAKQAVPVDALDGRKKRMQTKSPRFGASLLTVDGESIATGHTGTWSNTVPLSPTVSRTRHCEEEVGVQKDMHIGSSVIDKPDDLVPMVLGRSSMPGGVKEKCSSSLSIQALSGESELVQPMALIAARTQVNCQSACGVLSTRVLVPDSKSQSEEDKSLILLPAEQHSRSTAAPKDRSLAHSACSTTTPVSPCYSLLVTPLGLNRDATDTPGTMKQKNVCKGHEQIIRRGLPELNAVHLQTNQSRVCKLALARIQRPHTTDPSKTDEVKSPTLNFNLEAQGSLHEKFCASAPCSPQGKMLNTIGTQQDSTASRPNPPAKKHTNSTPQAFHMDEVLPDDLHKVMFLLKNKKSINSLAHGSQAKAHNSGEPCKSLIEGELQTSTSVEVQAGAPALSMFCTPGAVESNADVTVTDIHKPMKKQILPRIRHGIALKTPNHQPAPGATSSKSKNWQVADKTDDLISKFDLDVDLSAGLMQSYEDDYQLSTLRNWLDSIASAPSAHKSQAGAPFACKFEKPDTPTLVQQRPQSLQAQPRARQCPPPVTCCK